MRRKEKQRWILDVIAGTMVLFFDSLVEHLGLPMVSGRSVFNSVLPLAPP